MYYIYFTDSSKSIQKSTLNSPSQEALSQTEKKTESVFSQMRDSLLTLFYRVKTTLSQNKVARRSPIFEGTKLASTHNAGKPEEASTYVHMQKNPHVVPQETLNILAKAGIETPQPMQLSPLPIGEGMCNGGVTLFLKESLTENVNVKKIAQKFETGIPVEGVLHQALYTKLSFEGMDRTLSGVWDELKKRNQSPTNNKEYLKNNKSQFDSAKWRAIDILINYLTYLEERPAQDPLEYVEKKYKTLDAAEKKALYQIVSEFEYGTKGEERLALEIKGLAIDSLRPDTISRMDTSPTSILNRIDSLKSGSYKLSFPCYTWKGEYIGNHTIAFKIQENGTTLFYEPNYSTTVVRDKKKAVKKIFRRYTGYSAKGNNTLVRQIKNTWKGYANPPKNPKDLKGFELLKIRAK